MIPRSITSRLVFFYCLLLVLLGGGFLSFTVFSFQHYTRETIAKNLDARAQEIWNVSESSLQQPRRLEDIIQRRFSPESQDRFIRIRTGNRLLYQSGEPEIRDFTPGRVPPVSPAEGARTVGNLLVLARRFEDARLGPVTVESGQSFQFARTVQARLATSLFVGLPVLLLLAALAGYILMRSALKPIEAMIAAAEIYTFNDPHNRLPLMGTEPRIEALGLALNRMLDRLDNAYSHVSRFSADAAHELRTPLTIIRGELELIASEQRTSEDIEKAVDTALEEMTRLSGIVDSLITLSRMESLWGKAVHSRIDLHALAIETIDQISLLAVEKEIALTKPGGPPVPVAGDRERIKQIIVNLIDNAIKYTPRGGKVVVETGIAGERGYLAVEDNGIGIDPAHHDKVFDRFYRVLPDRGEVGAGLGLAIVKSICQAHGGTISLHSVPQFGTSIRVELPLASALLPGEKEVAAAVETAAAIQSIKA